MKYRMKQFALLCAGILLCMGLTSCSGNSKTPESEIRQEEEGIQIGLSFDSFVIERWLRDRDMFVSTAKNLGAKVNVQVANGSAEEQIEQIEYFIRKKMDVIVVVAVDGEALAEVIAKAKNAGIKVVCYDRLIVNAPTDLYISFDNRMVGTLMGEALKESCPQGGKILGIYGSPTDHNVTQVTEGFLEAIEGSNLELVYTGYCDNWLAEMAFEHVNAGLSHDPDIVGIMCGNDDLAGQAIKALAENRMAGSVSVVAQDAELSGCQRIVEGTQYMTVYKSVETQAKAAAQLAVALGEGLDITSASYEQPVTGTITSGTYEIPCYSIEPVAVTADNLEDVIINGGFHSAEDVYLNVNSDKQEKEQ